MTSITIHNLEPDLETHIRNQAREKGESLNKTIQRLLGEALGVASRDDSRSAFADLCGVWTQEDAQSFRRATSEFSQVHEEEWV